MHSSLRGELQNHHVLWSRAGDEQIILRTAATSLKDFYYIFMGKSGRWEGFLCGCRCVWLLTSAPCPEGC